MRKILTILFILITKCSLAQFLINKTSYSYTYQDPTVGINTDKNSETDYSRNALTLSLFSESLDNILTQYNHLVFSKADFALSPAQMKLQPYIGFSFIYSDDLFTRGFSLAEYEGLDLQLSPVTLLSVQSEYDIPADSPRPRDHLLYTVDLNINMNTAVHSRHRHIKHHFHNIKIKVRHKARTRHRIF